MAEAIDMDKSEETVREALHWALMQIKQKWSATAEYRNLCKCFCVH